MTKRAASRYAFDGSAIYQIQVLGTLTAAWSERLEGMEISVSTAADGRPVTTLSGELADQAALAGVMSQIYTMQLTVLSVTRIEDANN